MKPGKKPQFVKVGSTKIPIYHTPADGRDRYTIAYYEAGKRKRKIFDDLSAAKAEATTIATRLANGQHAVLKLTAADQESYSLAMAALDGLDVPLHAAVEEYAAARRLVPDGMTLISAMELFAQRLRGSRGDKDVSEVVLEFLESRRGR